MSSFTAELKYSPTGTSRNGRQEYRLDKEFGFYCLKYQCEIAYVIVPKGFVTDLASIPPCARWLFKPNGPYAKAAIIHDYLYETMKVDRKAADLVFLEAMEVAEVGYITRQVLYWATRLFGWRSFGLVVRGKLILDAEKRSSEHSNSNNRPEQSKHHTGEQ